MSGVYRTEAGRQIGRQAGAVGGVDCADCASLAGAIPESPSNGEAVYELRDRVAVARG